MPVWSLEDPPGTINVPPATLVVASPRTCETADNIH
jgi:hypothetical protein